VVWCKGHVVTAYHPGPSITQDASHFKHLSQHLSCPETEWEVTHPADPTQEHEPMALLPDQSGPQPSQITELA
ncbi:hypothetical protein NDU88_001435, partial [Pleurodeles waltl]